MKSLVIIATILSAGLFANASCLGEAQIIAKASSKELIKGNLNMPCSVKIESVSILNQSMVCPLILTGDELILLPRQQDGQCNHKEINGVLVKTESGVITLD